MKKDSAQTLVLVLVVVALFTSTIVAITSITTHGLRMRKLEEVSLRTTYASDTGWEAGNYIANKGSAFDFEKEIGAGDYYIDVTSFENKEECLNSDGKICLFDKNNGTYDQATVELWFKINQWPENRKFSVILGRGSPNDDTVYGGPPAGEGIGRDFEIAISGLEPPDSLGGWFKYCPRRIHFRALSSVVGLGNRYLWFPIMENLSTTNCDPEDPIAPLELNKWYHLIINNVEHPLAPAFYVYLDNKRVEPIMPLRERSPAFHTARNAGIQGGNFPIRIGKPLPGAGNEYVNFNGLISEVRIYKHPQFCGNQPTFFPNISPGSSSDPNDPLNHYKGIYKYRHNKPCCFPGSLFVLPICICGHSCDTNVGCGDFSAIGCGFPFIGYHTHYPYPPDYDMENDLVLHYNAFNTLRTCKKTNGSYPEKCIKDLSGKGNHGTPKEYGSDDNLLTSPGPPRSLLFGGNLGIENELSNRYKYSFKITPFGYKSDGTGVCNCDSSPPANCCCQKYCIGVSASPP